MKTVLKIFNYQCKITMIKQILNKINSTDLVLGINELSLTQTVQVYNQQNVG